MTNVLNASSACASKSRAAGSGARGSLQCGNCASAAASATRARPCGVLTASSSTRFTRAELAASSSTRTRRMSDPGARSVRNAKAPSRAVFSMPSEPETEPQSESAPWIAASSRSASATLASPPIEVPHAIVRRGRPTSAVKVASTSSWSVGASSSAQPAPEYDDAASA